MKSGRAALRYAKALLDFSIQIQEEKTVFGEMQNICSVMPVSYTHLTLPTICSV